MSRPMDYALLQRRRQIRYIHSGGHLNTPRTSVQRLKLEIRRARLKRERELRESA